MKHSASTTEKKDAGVNISGDPNSPVYLMPNEPDPAEVAQQQTAAKEVITQAAKSTLNAETQAKLFSALFDNGQKLMFTALQKRKAMKVCKTRANYIDALETVEEIKEGLVKFKDLEKAVQKRVKAIQKMTTRIERIPLDSDEKEMFIHNLSEIIKANNYQMPAHIGIGITVFAILAVRIPDLVMD